MKLKCSLIMEATHSERSSIDIHATVKKNQDIVPKILAAHGLTGCDSVVMLHVIEKGTAIIKLKPVPLFRYLGNLCAPLDEVIKESIKFICACYSIKERNNLSEARVDVWSKKVGKESTT